MSGFSWGPSETARLDAIRDDLSLVSTASANQLLIKLGWRNTYMVGLRPLATLGRARRYLLRRGGGECLVDQVVKTRGGRRVPCGGELLGR